MSPEELYEALVWVRDNAKFHNKNDQTWCDRLCGFYERTLRLSPAQIETGLKLLARYQF